MSACPWRYGPEDYKVGRLPPIPLHPHLMQGLLEPKILYHYTAPAALCSIITMGVFPGGVSSEKPFVFLTKESPWEILESGDKELIKLRPICLALDVELMAMQGYRLLESESGHYLTEDWISNVCLMYAYDFQQDQYLWTARAYPSGRISTTRLRDRP